MNKTFTNLKMVVDKLPKLAEQYPEIITDFNMFQYGCYSGSDISNPVCGTSGCLLGNMARLFDVRNKNYYSFSYRLNEWYFSYDSFLKEEFPDIDGLGLQWSYLFSFRWSMTDKSTFNDAIERVKYYISVNGNITEEDFPDGFFN